ncbi:hypothetical protein DENIS_3417 [Desulfonema ishimotonii]|uniref:Uncharacterized protein n=1 Tax=Desulfonema ishimotonii TaxID=45657 RepID=A0A401FZP9_9BACT|nr:hypothetical protein [Desulfonema ishimotonii]GBC62445.1 hypothetical protein DENIS_3417 [Desulfonema ishimotonii]
MIKVDDAESRLTELLEISGFNVSEPDIQKAWSVFKQFAKETVDCNKDSILFQTGCYGGKCSFDFVRQFLIHDEDGEYDHIEQLHMEFTCELTDKLICIEKNLWSDHFDCLEDYFEKVESLTEFQEAMECDFGQSEVYQEIV